MKRIRIIVGLALLLGVVSCSTVAYPQNEPVSGTDNEVKPVYVHNVETEEEPFQFKGSGISPAKVIIGDPEPRYYSGAIIQVPLEIYNGSDASATYSIIYQPPNPHNMYPSSVIPPPEASQWIRIEPSELEVGAKSMGIVVVYLEVPEGVYVAPQWEFRVTTKDISQGSMVQVAHSQRWIIYQKEEEE